MTVPAAATSQPDVAPGLTTDERHEVEHRVRPRALVIHETIRIEGEHELHRRPAALFWSGLAAGLSMGVSIVAMGVLRAGLPEARWAPLVVDLGYAFGFLVIILGRQQLFTENTLTPVLPLLYNRNAKTLVRLLRLWAVVLAANVLGAWLFGAVAVHTSVLGPEVRHECVELARAALAGSGGSHFVRAVFSGWIIALLVWVLPNAEGSRAFVIVAFTYLIGAADLSHVIAGSAEGAVAVFAGETSPAAFTTGFFLPVLAGNVVGGSALVAVISHAQIAAEARQEERRRGELADVRP